MQKHFFLLVITYASFTAIAQKQVPAFGKISLDELKLASCPFENDAPAMKLFDVQETEFSYGYDSKLKTERRIRLKIFNEKGYKHASIKIPYFSKKGISKIKDLRGAVYNLDGSGKIITQKLEKKDFFKSKFENNAAEIDFTFPNLKPGSVIEFSYTKIEKNILDIDPWVVQDDIPTAYSEIAIITPEESRIKEKVFGEDSVQQRTENIDAGKIKKSYFKENIKSFRYEPFMSSFKDNLLRIVFILIPETNFFINAVTSPEAIWKFVGSHLLEAKYFGGQIEKVIPGTEGLIDSAKKIKQVSERIQFIYDSVKKRAPDEVEQTMDVDDLTEAWNNKNGTSSEINLILLNILQKANIASCAMLVSTRDHGKINTDFPSPAQFNGVDVLAVDSNTVYPLDASLKWQSFQNPPFNILNRNAFLLLKKDMKWVTIDDNRFLLRQNTLINSTIKEDGNIEGTLTAKYYDYARMLVLDSANKEANDDQFVTRKPVGLEILSQKLIEGKSDAEPLEQQIEFNFETQKTNNLYFIKPDFFASNQLNPFLSSTRNTDIDFGCNQQLSITFLLNIPSIYHVESLPKNITVRAPDSSFFYRRVTSIEASRIYMTETFEIHRPVFGKEEYSGIQEFFRSIYALKAEEIILKKN